MHFSYFYFIYFQLHNLEDHHRRHDLSQAEQRALHGFRRIFASTDVHTDREIITQLLDVLYDLAKIEIPDLRTLDVIITMSLSIVKKVSISSSAVTDNFQVREEDIFGMTEILTFANDQLMVYSKMNVSSMLKQSLRIDDIIDILKTLIRADASLDLHREEYQYDGLPKPLEYIMDLAFGSELMRSRLMKISSKEALLEKLRDDFCPICLDQKFLNECDISILDGCSHHFCTSCTAEWFRKT